LWWLQVVTGFLLFFLGPPHLYQMLMHPGGIGPYGSADRVWSSGGGSIWSCCSASSCTGGWDCIGWS
jgi:hypothetical protein